MLLTPVERIEVAWDITIATTGAEAPLPDDVESVVQTAVVTYTNETLAIGQNVQPEEAAAAIRVALPTGRRVARNRQLAGSWSWPGTDRWTVALSNPASTRTMRGSKARATTPSAIRC